MCERRPPLHRRGVLAGGTAALAAATTGGCTSLLASWTGDKTTKSAGPRFPWFSCGAALPDSRLAASGTAAKPPAVPLGFDARPLQNIELGPEIGVPGRGLRMTRVTVAPGAFFPAHSHADAPEIIYVLEGQLTEERNGAAAVGYGPGSVLTLTRDVTHSLANRSQWPTIYMSTSVRR